MAGRSGAASPGTRIGAGRHQEVEVTDDPNLVADEDLVRLVDGLRKPSGDQHDEPHDEGDDLQAESRDPHRNAGRDHQDESEEHRSAMQFGGGWHNEAGAGAGWILRGEGREAIGQEEGVGLEPEQHPQQHRHHRPHESWGASRGESGEPSEKDTDQGGDLDEEDDHRQGKGQEEPQQHRPPSLLLPLGQDREDWQGLDRRRQVRVAHRRRGGRPHGPRWNEASWRRRNRRRGNRFSWRLLGSVFVPRTAQAPTTFIDPPMNTRNGDR